MKLRELFSDPRAWTQGSLAQDADGYPCTLGKGERFCLMGGMYKCYPFEEMPGIIAKISSRLGFVGGITAWNDTHTHSEVLALCTELDI